MKHVKNDSFYIGPNEICVDKIFCYIYVYDGC